MLSYVFYIYTNIYTLKCHIDVNYSLRCLLTCCGPVTVFVVSLLTTNLSNLPGIKVRITSNLFTRDTSLYFSRWLITENEMGINKNVGIRVSFFFIT